MENCAIYSHQLDFEKVINIIKTELPRATLEVNDGGKQKGIVATIKGGFFGKDKTLKINYRERDNPSFKLDQVECGLTQNLAGMVNFIQNFPASNPALRDKFLHKVRSANCEMGFMAVPAIIPAFDHILREITNSLDAFIFAQPGNYFQKSDAQHFLDKDLNLIIDQNGQMEVTDINVTVDAKYHDPPKEKYTEEQLSRKSKSEAFLNTNGIKVNTNLPCLSDASNISLRSTKAVIDRAYALMILAARGEGVAKDKLAKPIQEKSINCFTPKEKSVLEVTELSDQQKAYATWRYESLYTLLWALNIFPELTFPSKMCDVPAMVSKLLQPLKETFTQQTNLRSADEILDELDKIYRMNWACVDARIKGAKVSGSIHPGIVYERHYSLNWLTKYQDQEWDEVQTNT